jgi:hypothetical protein
MQAIPAAPQPICSRSRTGAREGYAARLSRAEGSGKWPGRGNGPGLFGRYCGDVDGSGRRALAGVLLYNARVTIIEHLRAAGARKEEAREAAAAIGAALPVNRAVTVGEAVLAAA